MTLRVKRSNQRRLSFQSLETRRLMAVFSSAELSTSQSFHVSALQTHCNTAGHQIVYYEDFEAGLGGFTADNTGGTLPGLWHYSLGRSSDGNPDHSPISSFYYGLFETDRGGGRYDTLPFDHQGTLISPPISIPVGTNTLAFNNFLHTRLPLDVDFVDVSIVDLDTPSNAPVQVFSRQNGTLGQTTPRWRHQCVEIPASFAGGNIQLRFTFDTGNVPNIDPEGWYVDDILITNVPPPVPQADVSIKKEVVGNDKPFEGQTVTFLVTASNASTSPNTATNVIVADLLPLGFEFQTSTPTEGNYDAGTGVWNGLELSPGESQTLTLVVTIGAGTEGTNLTNVATVTAQQFDPDTTNNRATATVMVQADPSIQKQSNNTKPVEGVPFEFTITVTNNTTVEAPQSRLQVMDKLPAGLTYVSEVSPIGDYDPITGIWNNFTLPVGGSATLKIVASANPGTGGTPITNTAMVNRKKAEATINPIPQPEEQVVQFITPLSVFRNGLTTGLPSPTLTPGQITGFLWADIDVDGLWDADEKPRSGYQVFIDRDNNGIFDPQTEPDAVSDLNGRYTFIDGTGGFTNLAAGVYTLREVDFVRGTNVISTFPASGAHQITITASGGPQGESGKAEVPNFGSFEFSTLVRPANQFVEFLSDYPTLSRSLIPWQSFQVENPTNAEMSIVEWNLDSLNADERPFVKVYQPSGNSLTIAALPLRVAANSSISLVAIYDPAIRIGGNVDKQSPDWLGANTPVHAFGSEDRLVAKTDIRLSFPVKLVGGSTYDSDVSHDGMIDQEDFTLIVDVLNPPPRTTSVRRIIRGEPGFDPTLDVNARCPNGADAVTMMCNFGSGIPVREIALGDLGPINDEVLNPIVAVIALQKVLAAPNALPVMTRMSVSEVQLQWVMSEEICLSEPVVLDLHGNVYVSQATPNEMEPLFCVMDELDREKSEMTDLEVVMDSMLF